MLTDFHSHILPGIDDGSRDIQETEKLIDMEIQQGVGRIIFTPHFYASQVSMSKFIERRDRAYEKVCDAMVSDGTACDAIARGSDAIARGKRTMLRGAEVYFFPGMGNAEGIEQLCIEGTNLILVEMPFAQWTDDMVREVQSLIEKKGLRVILAHIERYLQFQKNMGPWDRMFRLPVIPQMNAGPFIPGGLFDFQKNRKSKMCLELVKKYGPVLLGTDCHNLHGRKPNLEAGYRVIREKLGEKAVEEMVTFGDKILEDAAK